MKSAKVLNFILPIISIAAVISVWAVAAIAVDNEYILPDVSVTVKAFFALFADKEFYVSLLGTLARTFIGLVCSFVAAFVLAALSAEFKAVERVVAPIIGVIRALPTVAVVLLLLLWTSSSVAPIIVTALVVTPTVYTQIYGALIGIEKSVLEAGRVDGADEKQVFLYIETPLILPNVYRAAGSGLSLNFKLMVAAEVIAQTAKSIGLMLNISKAYFEYARMFALVCVAVIFGLVVEFVFNKLAAKAEYD